MMLCDNYGTRVKAVTCVLAVAALYSWSEAPSRIDSYVVPTPNLSDISMRHHIFDH